ncbi:MAG TPA: helix-turn-helix transcriptional regulator [Gammaproteobacteria bacterium]|jgi:transcriptional regulator with XRE-family HTH domain
MPFHENLRTLRLARGLTQPLLAEKAGIEQSYLSKLENGRSKPSEDVLARLAQALEVKAETLTQDGDESEERSQRWKRVGLGAAAAAVLVVTFIAGRATAVYPLSIGEVISGATASENTAQEILGLAPAGVQVMDVNGPHGTHFYIAGFANGQPAVTNYMDAIRKRFGGGFVNVRISPNADPTGMRHFDLDYDKRASAAP